MTHTFLKISGITLIAVTMTAGTALAGAGKNCDHKKRTSASSEAAVTTTAETAVMGVSATSGDAKAKMHKTYTFDEAVSMCQKKGAADLQACIDYKTGAVSAKPKT